MVKSVVKSSLDIMDIPDGILRKTANNKEAFDNVGMARKFCLNNNKDTFEGFKQAVNEYLDNV